MSDLRTQLGALLIDRVCLMGVGNPDYGDDGLGVRLAEALQAKDVPDVVVAGTTPERWIGWVTSERFPVLLFLDAVDFGGSPGSLVFMNSNEIAERFPQISTHKMSLGLLAQYAETNGGIRVWLLGAQPETLKPCFQLSPALQTTLSSTCELICELAAGRLRAATGAPGGVG